MFYLSDIVTQLKTSLHTNINLPTTGYTQYHT